MKNSDDKAILYMDTLHGFLGLFDASLYTYRAFGFFEKPLVVEMWLAWECGQT